MLPSKEGCNLVKNVVCKTWTVNENSIEAFVEANEDFAPLEVQALFRDIATCIKNGSNAAFFAPILDKLTGNVLVARNEEAEQAWQEQNDHTD